MDPFDLLTGDLPKPFNSATPQPPINYNVTSASSKTSSLFNPLSNNSTPNAIRHKIPPPQQFASTGTISQPTELLFSAATVNPSASFDFADFDAKFNSLKVDKTSTEQSVISAPTSTFSLKNDSNILPQSTSMFASSSSNTFSTASSIPWPTSNVESQKGIFNFAN